jgi:hypothetical protein
VPGSVEQVAFPEQMWDIPRIIGARQNRDAGFSYSQQLSPTATTPAVWGINATNTVVPYLWEIIFSTTVAISVSVYYKNGAHGLGQNFPTPIGPNASLTPTCIPGCAVVAAPALQAGPIIQGTFPAGFYGSLLGKGWVSCGYNRSLVVVTGLVVATCMCNFYWGEYTD